MRNLIVIFLFGLLFPIQAISQNQNSVEGDRQALVDLYNTAGGSSWSSNTGWLDGNPSDNWFGVEVNSEGRVVRLNLSENNLSGELPESIGNLTRLQYINIKQNKITGRIPSSIGNWVEIESLYLSGGYAEDLPDNPDRAYHPGKSDDSGNTFTGEFPDVWSNFTKLKVVQISGSSLTSILTEGIGSARDLEMIEMSWNLLWDKELPRSLSNLSQLTKLYLRSNALIGTIPPLNQMTELRQFHVGNGNNLTGDIPDFSNNTKLREVILDNNNLTGNWGHYWNNGQFTNLIGLRATWNNITGTLHGFENLDLRTFVLDGNNLEGEIPESITSNSNLILLGLGWNSFIGKIPQEGWEYHTNTRYIRFSNNKLEGAIPDKLPNSSSLQYLYFANNNLSGSISLDGAKYNDSSTYDRFNHIDISNNAFSESDYKPLLDELGSSKLRVGDQNPEDSGSTDEPTAPSTPSLQSPSSNATGVSVNPSFSWSSVSSDSYTLRVYTSSGSLVFENTGTGTSYTTSSSRTLKNDTKYTWRVRATRDGLTGYWSSFRSFTTESTGSGDDSSGSGSDPLTSPDLASPKDGATGVSLTPTLEWNNLNADYYILHLDTPTTEGLVIDAEVNGTSYSVKNNESLNSETLYKWRVRGVKDGVPGEWSSIAEFTTQGEGGGNGNNGRGPQKSTPAKDEKKVSKKTTFKWESVESAESYTIEVREASTSTLFVAEEVTDTMYVSAREMKGNTEYVWRVRATVQGQPGEWSDEWEFTTTDESDETALEVELSQNYPNPFNPSTNIRFTINEQQEVSLKVYDMAGRLVANLIDGSTLSAGTHNASFNANSLASGIYFYRLITPGEIVTRKMTLMK